MKKLTLKKLHGESEALLHRQVHLSAQGTRRSRALRRTSELERRRAGQELHNKLCQQLTGASLLAKALSQRLGPWMPSESVSASEISEIISDAIRQTRNYASKISSCGSQPRS